MLSKSKITLFLLSVAAFFAASAVDCKAQFKEEAFQQSYNDDTTAPSDSVDKIFSIKEYFGGLSHKNPIEVATAFEGSLVLVGGMQIYNKDYWKLPVVYGGIAAGVGGGLYYMNQGNTTASNLAFAAAGLVYWGSLLDGTICYKPDDYPVAGKATIYSILLPGLGQIYNHEVWKLPIYWGVMVGGFCYYQQFKRNYERFANLYNNSDTSYIPLETSKYYKNYYRRYRDYALLVVGLGYLLQVIDANVFAYMHNFEVDDDLAIDISPALLPLDSQFAFNSSPAAFGLTLGVRF